MSDARPEYTGVIESAGGRIFCESCPNVADTWPKDARGLAFDSAKQADCISAKARGRVYYGSMTDCLESAVTGKWVNIPWKQQ